MATLRLRDYGKDEVKIAKMAILLMLLMGFRGKLILSCPKGDKE